jgi:hypothetical protein
VDRNGLVAERMCAHARDHTPRSPAGPVAVEAATRRVQRLMAVYLREAPVNRSARVAGR